MIRSSARPPRAFALAVAITAFVLVVSSMVSAASIAAISNVSELRTAVQGLNTVTKNLRILPGLYVFTEPLVIASNIVLSADAPGTVTFSGNYISRILDVRSPAQLTLANLTLAHGKGESPPNIAGDLGASSGGGCIAAYTSSSSPFLGSLFLSMMNVTFQECATSTGNGGAVLLHVPLASTFQCDSCTFENNSALSGFGGAIYVDSYSGSSLSAFRLGSSVFSNNMARSGGAIQVEIPAQQRRLESVTFYNNQAEDSGGAIVMAEDLSLLRCSFRRNFAGIVGHAIQINNEYATLSMDNETVFEDNGGIDGFPNSVIRRTHARQVQIVAFSPAPTSTPWTFPPVQTAPPVTLPPDQSFPTSPPNSPSSKGNDFVAVGVGIALGLLFALMGVIAFVARKRRDDNTIANSQDAAEAHNAFSHRRQWPKVVSITELMSLETADSLCSICSDISVDSNTVKRCVDTHSAKKYKINNVPALTALYARVECGHVYHVACLIVWTEVNNRTTCPECRHTIAFESKPRFSSVNSSDSSLDGRRASRRSTIRHELNNNGLNESQMTITVPADAPFSHEARRSANNDDQVAEQNAILVRELDAVQSRRATTGNNNKV